MHNNIVAFPAEVIELTAQIRKFQTFLNTRGFIRNKQEYQYKFVRSSERDFIMEVDDTLVTFNPALLKQKRCSFEYYLSVILHELTHLLVHNIPNKSDAKRVKNSFSNVTMRQFDVEADAIVAWYLKECMNFSLVKYFLLILEGTRVFGDPEVESNKVERFIGTLMSTSLMFSDSSTNQKTYRLTFYLPCLCNRFNAAVPILVQSNGFHSIAECKLTDHDMHRMREIYVNSDDARLSEYGCIRDMITVVEQVLSIKISLPVRREMEKLK